MSGVLWFFEIGYLLQHAATISQIYRINKKKNTEMVSLETNILFFVGACSRLGWMYDSMLKNFWLSYVELFVGFVSLVMIIYLYNKYKANNLYVQEVRMPIFIRIEVLLPVILLLAFCFHPGTKGDYYLTNQMFVSLSIFSEAIGLLPQLYLIKTQKETGNLSQFYVLFLAIARLFRLFFWLKMYFDGNQFLSLIIADLIHCILLSDFVYNVIKNWNSIVLPTFDGGRVDNNSNKKIY